MFRSERDSDQVRDTQSLGTSTSSTSQGPSTQAIMEVAFRITGAFEGGKSTSYQNKDSGIVSFGKHQATLASGSLGNILSRYVKRSTSKAAQTLAAYMSRVQKKDPGLRNDEGFKQALLATGTDPVMGVCQDEVFAQIYWPGAESGTRADNLRSPLALAMYYDTNIQGGLADVRKATAASMSGKPPSEAAYLTEFNKQRDLRLQRLVSKKKALGKTADAKWLEGSRSRVTALQSLVAAGDLQLRGDGQGILHLGSHRVAGLVAASGATSGGVTSGGVTAPETQTSAPEPTKPGRGPGSSSGPSPVVKELQLLLVKGDYMTTQQMQTGPGILGPRTHAALTRLMDNQRKPGPSPVVKEMQTLLVKRGYMTMQQMQTGPGILGPRTHAALTRLMDDQEHGTAGSGGSGGRTTSSEKITPAPGQAPTQRAPIVPVSSTPPNAPSYEQISKDFKAPIPGSTYFTWHQALWLPSIGRHASAEEATWVILQNIVKQAQALDRVRDHFKKPIVVHCWLRPPAYNKKIGGARNSAHLRGTATDFHLEGYKAEAVRQVLRAQEVLYPGAGELGVTWMHLDLEHKIWFHP